MGLGATTCDDGAPVGKDDCTNAVITVLGFEPKAVYEDSWSHIPAGCSYYPGDDSAFWNTHGDGASHASFKVVCVEEAASTVSKYTFVVTAVSANTDIGQHIHEIEFVG